MNKTAIKNFAVWARRKLISDITYKAGMLGITDSGIAEPLPISTKDLQFFDIGTKDYADISGSEIEQRKALIDAIKTKEKSSKSYKEAFEYVVEEVAYTWFNRLIAVRFMEVNDYLPSGIRVLSSENSAKHEPDLVTMPFETDLDFTPFEQDKVIQLKDENKLDELFRMLFIKQCNKLHEILPELFEKTDDYTELLLTISFTDKDGVVYHLTHDISEDDFNVEKEGQVEIIGWLYQYYNTEQNELVYDGSLSRNRISKELLPAATTIYTPDWAIKYMVENSLGKLWLNGHTNASLKSKWKYYLDEAQQEAEVQNQLDEIRNEYKNITPEEIKVIDPCMGSGHILVYAFDVLMQIYESYGYTQRDAARSILINNIYGLDISKRAYQLAYFAVMIKARQYNRRILTENIAPNLFAIKESNEISNELIKFIANGDVNIENDLTIICDELYDATEYGSILNITNINFEQIYNRIAEIKDNFYDDIFGQGYQLETDSVILPLIKQAEAMAQKYDAVITNPPYLGNSRFSPKLDKYVKDNYVDEKADLSMVMYKHSLERFGKKGTYTAFITTSSWMYLSSLERIRNYVQNNAYISSIVDFGTELFDGKVGHNPIVAWVTQNCKINYSLIAVRLVDYCYSRRNEKEIEFFNNRNYYVTTQSNFSKIPGSPVAYWVSKRFIDAFSSGNSISTKATPKQGMSTCDVNRFVKMWYEVDINKTNIYENENHRCWIKYNKGGEYRKWYGNRDSVVLWHNNGDLLKANNAALRNQDSYFEEFIAWTKISSSGTGFRNFEKHFLFDGAGGSLFLFNNKNKLYYLGFLNSSVCTLILSVISPTLNFNESHIGALPIIESAKFSEDINCLVNENVNLSKKDWDSFETSWDFKKHPLIWRHGGKVYYSWNNNDVIYNKEDVDKIPWSYSLEQSYLSWKWECEERFNQLKANEEELNCIFIDIYGLQDELMPDVADKDITVHRIYDTKDDVPESMKGSSYVRTKRDEVVSLISYAVGCMFGRYSLDIEGLAYAGGEWDSTKYSTFIPDADNCIPITDEEYFEDDIVGLFCAWLKKVYGEDTLEENLDFIAKVLGNKGNTSRDVIRNYFLNDFIKDHIKIYKKRPIYWLFDSGKQNGFKALCYIHRWNADTIGNMHVEYLHRMQRVYEKELERMQDTIDNSTNNKEISAANKRKEKLQKQLKETKEYDAKVAHLALSRIDIDLDDGVKVNYEKVQTASDGTKLQILAKI